MKWTKQTYKIKMDQGWYEVEGSVCGNWGIDKRNSRYYLTYLPNGKWAESARTMKFLKELVDTDEFKSFDGEKENLPKLARVIQQARNKQGWYQ